MYSTVLAECPECKVERECRVLECDDCPEGECRHLRCLVCEEDFGD
jgi:hypothetical protein